MKNASLEEVGYTVPSPNTPGRLADAVHHGIGGTPTALGRCGASVVVLGVVLLTTIRRPSGAAPEERPALFPRRERQ
jgi:hypothetical protein